MGIGCDFCAKDRVSDCRAIDKLANINLYVNTLRLVQNVLCIA